MSINKLSAILDKHKNGMTFHEIKEEIQKALLEIDLSELYFFQHQMAEASIPDKDIKELCAVLIEKAGNKVELLKKKLNPEHVLSKLIAEHDALFALLEELRIINHELQDKDIYNIAKTELAKIGEILEILNETELHELKEETVLFPQLDSKGIFGHPYIMKIEHQTINNYRKELKVLISSAAEQNFQELKKKINNLVKFLIIKLSNNMSEENNVIYPLAFEVIEDEAVWDDMKSACNRIGYFSFNRASSF